MNARSLLVLGVVTLVVVAAAGFVLSSRASQRAAMSLDLFFPRLADDVNAAAVVTIEDGTGLIRLERADGRWVSMTNDGYPVQVEPLKQLLMALSQLRPLEPKTDDPARYGQIGVVSPGEGRNTVSVTVLDQDGTTIAALLLGNRAAVGRFVRVPDEARSWLADLRIDASSDSQVWLNRSLLSIPVDRIARVEILHPDGAAVRVVRDAQTDRFVLQDVPPGRQPAPTPTITRVASAVASVLLDDVQPAVADEVPEDVTRSTYETNDGLRVVLQTWVRDGGTAARVSVEAVDAAAEEEAATIGDVVDGWTYRLSPSSAMPLRTLLDAVTTPAPQPTELPGPVDG
ncbi:MAG: DUF4340 domain-containing protein [Planctomycetota bacterium]